MLTGCLDEITSSKGGLEREILSLNEYKRHKERASHIECDLFDLRVAFSRRMEGASKKEPTSDKFGLLAMTGVNFHELRFQLLMATS